MVRYPVLPFVIGAKYQVMTIFLPCPSYYGYSASLDGQILSPSFTSITKLGKTRVNEGRVLKHVGRHQAYVILRHDDGSQNFVQFKTLVRDAWGCEPSAIGSIDHSSKAKLQKPRPSYRDGKIITFDEWMARALNKAVTER